MSWNLLERFIESDHFNQDPSFSVAYLSRYADHVGIHYVLCQKLRQFSYEEIEFFLPQLCHLLISVDNESMALEEFIIDLCEESVNGALLTFWLFQTYLHDLFANPQSNAFKTCRRIFNKVQRIVFGGAEPSKREKIKENILPTTVLSSIVLASIAAPFLPRFAGPLAIAQARKPRPTEDVISEQPVQKLGRSHTVAGTSARPRRPRQQSGYSDGDGENKKAQQPAEGRVRSPTIGGEVPRKVSRKASGHAATPSRPSLLSVALSDARLSSSSLPDFRSPTKPSASALTPPPTAGLTPHAPQVHRRHSHMSRPLAPSDLNRSQKIRMLRSHYFRSETLFLSALEDISNRLVVVPKPARLSALRAELALIAQDLPAEVDIPVICPATLQDGSASKSMHHRIVRLNPAEATSLNSAERVPYLLMVEVLKEDFDFDPESEANKKLLVNLLQEGSGRRRLFDITDASRSSRMDVQGTGADSVFEPVNGDLSNTPLIQDPLEADLKGSRPISPMPPLSSPIKPPQAARSSSGTTGTRSSLATVSTPRTSDMDSRSGSPALRKMTLPSRSGAADQPDFNALATHMRTAAQMLAQLDSSGSKRPKVEVAAIKAKIIASMQSLEEQSFYNSDVRKSLEVDPTVPQESDELDDHLEAAAAEAGVNPSAGAARMENDSKTGGIQRKGDRDDPSAATFGEEWSEKKERIRRSSPYGWMKNWDLLSVIVKTGADLRQEAFACQLIAVCSKIWEEANVPVWTKRMRILVTGESSGLIETITNGVSLHSLKRSLTLAGIADGTNVRKRIATLKDHFVRTFGEEGSEGYETARDAFIRSLAAYSVISYVLQLKDRHNGNILIDNVGHIIHIDFGFMLSNSPGSMGFEAAPFKMTSEYVDVLGGTNSPAFKQFKDLCKQAFQALRKEAERIIMLVEMMGRESRMPCFAAGVQQASNALRARFVLQMGRTEAEDCMEELIGKACFSYYTRLYDTFQYRTQGIY